jgi:molybdopterin-guanine dinucleotide biosynthesis protein A
MSIEAAIILAGGRSSRMGEDKALSRFGTTTLAENAVARLRAQVGYLAVNANGDPARLAFLGLTVIADDVGGFEGPLAGVLAGLAWAKRAGFGGSHVLTVPVDAPFLPEDLAVRLAAAAPEAGTAVAASGGHRHPVIAAWSVSLAGAIAEHLSHQGPRGVGAFIDRYPTVTVPFEAVDAHGTAYDPFLNVNTPDELAEAEAIARRLARA